MRLSILSSASHAASLLDPLRRSILAGLATPDSAAGVARRLGLPRQQVNYHVRQLEEDGLLEAVGERRVRNCVERVVRAKADGYVIDPGALGGLGPDPDRVADRASSAYQVAVAARLIREVATLRAGAAAADRPLPTLTLETVVRFATPEAQRSFAAGLEAALAGLIERYHDDEAPDGRRFRVVAAAHPAVAAEPEAEG